VKSDSSQKRGVSSIIIRNEERGKRKRSADFLKILHNLIVEV